MRNTLSPDQRLQFFELIMNMENDPAAIDQFIKTHDLTWDHLRSKHKRLALILGMLGSNFPHERLAAVSRARKYMLEHWVTEVEVTNDPCVDDPDLTDEDIERFDAESAAWWDDAPVAPEAATEAANDDEPWADIPPWPAEKKPAWVDDGLSIPPWPTRVYATPRGN